MGFYDLLCFMTNLILVCMHTLVRNDGSGNDADGGTGGHDGGHSGCGGHGCGVVVMMVVVVVVLYQLDLQCSNLR